MKVDTTVNGGLILDVSGTQRGVFANDSAFGGGITDIGIGAKGNMIFRAGTSGYTERMRIHSTGVVQVMSENLTMGTSSTTGGGASATSVNSSSFILVCSIFSSIFSIFLFKSFKRFSLIF